MQRSEPSTAVKVLTLNLPAIGSETGWSTRAGSLCPAGSILAIKEVVMYQVLRTDNGRVRDQPRLVT